MKCAYCKEEVPEEDDSYEVEINGVECEIALHYDCLMKVIGEFFSRPPELKITKSTGDHITVKPDVYWTKPLTWDCGGTADCPPPDTTRVWCKTDDESSHTPWRDRVD